MDIGGKDVVVMFSIACVSILGGFYIHQGGDSVVLSSITGLIGTVLGYYFGIRGKE